MDETLERARRGDPAAMEALLSELAPRVQRFGLRLCGNAHDADDVLQDTLLGITQNLKSFEGRASLASWVFALARSACARRRRGLKNAPPMPDEAAVTLDGGGPTPEARAADQELLGAVLAALESLPVDGREVVLLRDVEGLSALETAEALGISVDAVKSRLHRARSALRERLKPVLESDATPPGPACPDIMTLWSRMLEGDLSQVDCARMQTHLDTCPACGAACSALKRALVVCQRAASTEVPPVVQAQVKQAVRAWANQRGPTRR